MAESIWGPIFQIGKLRLKSNLIIEGAFIQFNSQRLFTYINSRFFNSAMQYKYAAYAVYTKPTYRLFGLIKNKETILVKLSDVDPVSGEIKDYLGIDTYCSYQGIFVIHPDDKYLIMKHAKRIDVLNNNDISLLRSEYYKIKHLLGINANSFQICGPMFDNYYRDFCDFCRGVIITDMSPK